MKIDKQHDAVAWENWCDSKDGLNCLFGITEGQYLRNRLWRAFHAGIKHGKRQRKIELKAEKSADVK